MLLPVIKPKTYISPSALSTWSDCQNKYYNYYLAGYPYIPNKQSKAAAIGSIFDIHMKCDLNDIRRMGRHDLNEGRMLKKVQSELADDVSWDEVLTIARNTYSKYKAIGLLDEFVNAKALDLDRELYGQIEINNVHVPLLGILDILLEGKPDDIKTRGFGSSTKTSPYKGFIKRTTEFGMKLPPHADTFHMEDVNAGWARQMLFYCWLTDTTEGTIHEIVKMNGVWHQVIHKVTFSATFIRKTKKELLQLWLATSGLDAEIEPPTPNKWKCHKFNQLCVVASRCPKYLAQMESL